MASISGGVSASFMGLGEGRGESGRALFVGEESVVDPVEVFAAGSVGEHRESEFSPFGGIHAGASDHGEGAE